MIEACTHVQMHRNPTMDDGPHHRKSGNYHEFQNNLLLDGVEHVARKPSCALKSSSEGMQHDCTITTCNELFELSGTA